jgi:hypothetical protein
MKMLLSLLAMILMTAPAHAQFAETACGDLAREAEFQDIECLVKELIPRSFPELQAAWDEGRIHFEKFNSEDNFVNGTILCGFTRGPSARHYAIQINPAMTRTFLPALPRPSLQAVQGILAHELVHLSDYEGSSAIGLAKFLKASLIGVAEHERAVDERAFELGYAAGISLYRQWLYGRLGETEIAQKKARFYTPEEIHEWIMENELARHVH